MAAQWREPMSPNSATAPTVNASAPTVSTNCLHCGRDAGGRGGGFCCHGCREVHAYLRTAKLDEYYQVLERQQQHAPSQLDVVTERSARDEDLTAAFRWGARADSYAFYVPSLSCAACLWLMQKALRDVQGVDSIDVDLAKRLVLIGARGEAPQLVPQLLERMSRLGYRALPPRFSTDAKFQDAAERRRLSDLGLAWAAFGNVMLFATALYFGDLWGMSPPMARFLALFALLVSAAALPTAGRSFFANAWRSLRAGVLHIDLPIAAALLLAFGVSVANLASGGTRVYFDSVTGLIAFLLTGRHLAEGMAKRARDLAGSTLALIPTSAESLRVGDRIEVRVGERIPADGRVDFGETEVSEAALTGEQAPVLKRTGDLVTAGTYNLSGAFAMIVTAAGEDCRLAQVGRLIAEARASKASFETLAEAILRWFIAGIFLAAVAAGLIWWHLDPSRIVEVVCATLIVSCPCALALATPLVSSFALKRSWQHGVIVKSADVLERLPRIDTVVIDKTGTLTTGAMNVVHRFGTSLDPSVAEAVYVVASLSLHPVAKAVAASLALSKRSDASVEILSHRELPGLGIHAAVLIDGAPCELRLGSVAWLRAFVPEGMRAELDAAVGASVADGPQVAACWVLGAAPSVVAFSLSDPPSAAAAEVVARWRAVGLSVLVMSGDAHAAVVQAADRVGIPASDVFSGLSPEAKALRVKELEAAGKRVLMVGDGANDAAALATATVGVAVRGGVDVAIGAADAFSLSPGLGPVEDLRSFAVHTLTSLRIVLAVSVVYNVVAVGLALGGLVHPIVAALIMPLSSLTVILVAMLRGGSSKWKFCTSSCPLPSPSPAARRLRSGGLPEAGSSTT